MSEDYKFHNGYESQKFINKATGEIFDNVNAYNRSWYVPNSPAYDYFSAALSHLEERE